MKSRRSLRALAALAALGLQTAAADPGLVVRDDGTITRNGAPYAGIGVNYFNCFLRNLINERDSSYDAGFATLERYSIPFVRFAACGYWPREMSLYVSDRSEYFRRLDAVVASAEQHGLGLIPSFFWNYACVPDLVGEPCNQWGNPQGKTRAFMRKYVRDVVARYQGSRAIWAWEFGNEFNLAADLPNAAQHRPPIQPKLGTPATRSAGDDLSYADVISAWTEFAQEVRRLDRARLVQSGNAILRTSAWHNQHERNWKSDDAAQRGEMLRLTTPDPLNVVSVHCYDADLARIGDVVMAARTIGKPVFVGEFQVPDAANAAAEGALRRFLQNLADLRVPLAAIWVFDLPSQEKTFSISEHNPRGWQLPVLQEWNRALAAKRDAATR